MKTLLLLLLTLTVNAVDLTALLKEKEGFSTTVYICSEGYPTIGYGHRCDANHPEITREEAEKILAADIKEAMKGADKLIGANAPKAAKEIVVAMVFQMGYKGVSGFKKTLAFIKAGDYKSASKEMLNSRWAKQTPARAKFMSDMMASVK